MKRRKLNGDDSQQIMNTIRECIFKSHRFPQINDVAEQLGLSKTKCRQVCENLIKQDKLHIVFEGNRLPTIVAPYEMMQEVIRTQPKPRWMSQYEFEEKAKLDKQIRELQKGTYDYEIYERLLYTTGIPLEEAVAFTLKWLDFANVEHHTDTNKQDITFEYNGIKALVEVEGTIKAADKGKVQQLAGWLTQEIEEGRKVEKLQGFLVVNHFREKNPNERGDPLTSYAKQFLEFNRSRFFTTPFLFNIVKEVMKGVPKSEARQKVWEGQTFSE